MRVDHSLLLWLQAIASPPVNYDTRSVTQACSAARDRPDDIVVCGRRDRDRDRYRLPRLAPDPPPLGAAETSLGGTRVGVATERGQVGGILTDRIMVHLKIPL